jgi:HAD superfamily hydrolase (TIGR01490 family)
MRPDPLPPAPRIAAIFDLDDTLLTESTGRSILRYLRETKSIGRFVRRRDVVALLGSTLLYRYGALDITRMMSLTARAVRGVPVAEMWEFIERWFEERVKYVISVAAVERLAWHREQGHVPVMCTASSQFSADPVARYLGIEHVISTPWLDDGVHMTGEVRLPLSYGAGKVYWMRRWAQEQGVSLPASYFYTDHPSDLPLLNLVAHPVVVNPYAELERIAYMRDWPVVHWREPIANP